MKKKLEAELISIAHRILKLKDTSTLPQLQEEARLLYEKLTILSFAEAHFEGPQPTIGQVEKALNEEESDELKKVKEKIQAIIAPKPELPKDEDVPTTSVPVEEKSEEKTEVKDKPELIIEEINARVSEDLFVPASETTTEQPSFSEGVQSSYEKNDMEEVTPLFQNTITGEKPKSLNEQLRKDIHIGLNDRLAFIKHLFEGSTTDYNRVLSQLNTISDKKEAQDFIVSMVKPDYNNWEGKDEYEERFFDVVLSKYEH